MKVHPLTATFPTMNEEELLDLAQAIKKEGQHEPILLDADGVLLDGRNRLAACKLAGVEPRFATHTKGDPAAVAWALNIRRRHLTQGQRAMIIAKGRSVSKFSARDDAATYGISPARVSLATTVIKHAPTLVRLVITGAMGLDAAYEQARKHKAAVKTRNAQYDLLRAQAPDLAVRVTEGDLDMPAALTELERCQEEERLRAHVDRVDAVRAADGDIQPTLARLVDDGLIDWPEAARRADHYLAQRQDALRHSQQALQLIADHWDTVRSLAGRPDSALIREVLDNLTPEARTLAEELLAREADTPPTSPR
ncbi:ParB N-terminal domain-containing protein [Streptomyces sp. NRRL WC-3742]|uniref:ParB N-terminal domain-containing protein n=1 Tax=Streptomyces sp. NRRL WC-3742 TaxID=1463934 RepID=UPI00068B4649|nr:ParB N-terminal domain-containing protein [Streptomyces sp. NRRL WC-3742]